jgi:short-subunit dehydrogenase
VEFVQKNFAGFDTLLLAYGSMLDQTQCDHSGELTAQQLHTDFVSAAALLTAFADYFEIRKSGCMAVITSVAGDRIRRSNYVYGTAKGALTLFLAGLRSRLRGTGVKVLTIKPGPVNTAMTAHLSNSRKFADPELVARDICQALQRRAPEVVYTPAHWRYIMQAVRAIPEPIFNWLVSRHGPAAARPKKP